MVLKDQPIIRSAARRPTLDIAPQPADVLASAFRPWRWLAAGGPGLVLLLASIGPRDLVSNSVAGTNFGYSLLWTLVLLGVARFIVLEATARYVIATGESLLAGFRVVGGWAGWVVLGAIVLKRHLSNLYNVLLMGLALGWLTGADGSVGRGLAALCSCGVAFLIMFAGGYKAVERYGKPLALMLGAPFVLAIIWSRPDPRAILEGALIPVLPAQGDVYGPGLAVLLLVATSLDALSSLKYSAYVYEKGWRKSWQLRRQRIDLLQGMIGIVAVSALIQIAAASVLRPAGLRLERVEDLVPLFTTVLGTRGQVIMAIGLWTTVFTTYIGSNMGYSLIVADIVMAASPGGTPVDQTVFARRRRSIYRWCLILFCGSPLYVVWTDWRPVPILVASVGLTVLALPTVTLILMRLTADKRIMGDHANSLFTNLALLLVVVASLYLSYVTGVEILEEIGGV